MQVYGSVFPEGDPNAPQIQQTSAKADTGYDQQQSWQNEEQAQQYYGTENLTKNDPNQDYYNQNYDQMKQDEQNYQQQQLNDPEYDALRDDYSNNGYNYYGMNVKGEYNYEYDYYTQ